MSDPFVRKMPRAELPAYKKTMPLNPPASESELTKNWPQHDRTPLVSVICFTFNHAKYIAAAVTGFLAQETRFPFEIIIHDDASTDGTTAILEHYQQQFPSVIRLIVQSENQFSAGRKPLESTFAIARGRYFAFCEGDDFWTDSKKLSIQVETLEADGALSGCSHHNFVQRGSAFCPPPLRVSNTVDAFGFSLGRKAQTHMSSLMLRKNSLQHFDHAVLNRLYAGDNYLRLVALANGPIKVLPRLMSVYRLHNEGVWSSLAPVQMATRKLSDLTILSANFKHLTFGFTLQKLRIRARMALRALASALASARSRHSKSR